MVLIDKGYYDYDYQEPPESRKREELRNIVTVEDTKKSDAEVRNALAAFGWGRKTQESGESRAGELQGPLGAGELQELVMKDLKERKK